MIRVGVLDYGMGNLRSVSKAWERAGGRVVVSDDRNVLEKSDVLVVPGQGAFGAAAAVLARRGLIPFVRAWIREDRPYFGICLGLQLLFEGSDEAPGVKGLGVLEGRVRKFRPVSKKLKVPHMGWNGAMPRRGEGLFRQTLTREGAFYFVHSYYAAPEDRAVVWTETDFGGRFCSGVARRRLAAVQFHPEKSGEAGAVFLKKALKLVSKGL